jgi:hypothetical protein
MKRWWPARPLPEGTFIAGVTSRYDDQLEDLSPVLDLRAPQASEALCFGIDLFHAGFAFEAHEAWEAIWRVSDDDDTRSLVQGLIRLAAAHVKVRQGSALGVRAHAWGAWDHFDKLRSRHADRVAGFDLEALCAFAERIDDDAERLTASSGQGYAFDRLLPFEG